MELTRDHLASARANDVLWNLYYINAIREHYKNNLSKAYTILSECSKRLPIHPQSFGFYISFANIAYRTGRVEEARRYNDIAEKLKGENSLCVCLNRAFFSILDGNVDEIRKRYSKLSTGDIVWEPQQMTEVVGFLEDEKEKMPQKAPLLDFAQAILTKTFIDLDEGKAQLEQFIEDYSTNSELSPLLDLACTLVNRNKLRFAQRTNPALKQFNNKKKKKRKRKGK